MGAGGGGAAAAGGSLPGVMGEGWREGGGGVLWEEGKWEEKGKEEEERVLRGTGKWEERWKEGRVLWRRERRGRKARGARGGARKPVWLWRGLPEENFGTAFLLAQVNNPSTLIYIQIH